MPCSVQQQWKSTHAVRTQMQNGHLYLEVCEALKDRWKHFIFVLQNRELYR